MTLESAVARYRGEATSPQENDLGAPATFLDYYFNVDSEAEWDLADSNMADEPLKHTVLKTKFTDLQEACRQADVFGPSSILEVVHIAPELVSAPVPGAVFSNVA